MRFENGFSTYLIHFQTTCTSVRTWDHHFVSEDFKVCGKMAIKLKKQEQELDLNEVNQNDIRLESRLFLNSI